MVVSTYGVGRCLPRDNVCLWKVPQSTGVVHLWEVCPVQSRGHLPISLHDRCSKGKERGKVEW